jgi:hypothetical protein
VLPIGVVGQNPEVHVLPWQLCPQNPQLAGSLVVSTHFELHRVWPWMQAHVELAHVPLGHVTAQAPQFCGSLVRSTHRLEHIVHEGPPDDEDEDEELVPWLES